MKQILLAISIAALLAGGATAGTIDGTGTYHGTLQGVGVGFFGNVAVGLTDGATCNGQPVVVLLTSNTQYKDILAVSLSARAGGMNVRLNRMLDNIQIFGGTAYCVITSASLGDFPLW